MAYSATWVNKRDLPTGAEMTLLLTDGAGNYPDARIEKHFAGRTVAQCTAAFLNPIARAEAARAIQAEILRLARVILQRRWEQYYQVRIVPAMANLLADMQAQWASDAVQPSDIQARITTAWTNNGVAGVLNPPAVTVSGTDVSVSN